MSRNSKSRRDAKKRALAKKHEKPIDGGVKFFSDKSGPYNTYRTFFRYLMSQEGLPDTPIYEPDPRSALWFEKAENIYYQSVWFTIMEGSEKYKCPAWVTLSSIIEYAEKTNQIGPKESMERFVLYTCAASPKYSDLLTHFPRFLLDRGVKSVELSQDHAVIVYDQDSPS